MAEKGNFTTGSGDVEVKEIYTPRDVADIDFAADIGEPGRYPYTRGRSATGYRKGLWRMGVYSGFSSGDDANQRLRQLVQRGAQRLLVALDLPTQVGYDADSPEAAYEVGRVGVSINSLKDIEDLFEGIPIENMLVGTTGNAISPIALAWFIALAEKRNCPLDKVACQIQNDILKEFIVRGTYIFPLDASLRLTADVIEYCISSLPKDWTPAIVCGTHMRAAGATPAQTIAFTLSNAIAYLDSVRSRGVSVAATAPRFEFHFISGFDIFEEAAAFRALRKVWARIMRDRYGINDPHAQTVHLLSAVTPTQLFTAQQPLNNLARLTLSVVSAALGGVDEFSANCYDEALSIPTAEAVVTSLRAQQVVAYESGIPNVIDPLGGSYYVERLTLEIEDRIMGLIDKVTEMGGAVVATKQGYFQREITNQAYKEQKLLDSGEKAWIGVNKFRNDDSRQEFPIFQADPHCRERQIEKLRNLKAERNMRLVRDCLRRVEEVARTSENIVPAVLEAVKAYTTVGEICGVLRKVFGEYHQETLYT
ncbi:MAG: methylmalonyl-CoA mutase [Chloroflexi bacterium]|nr:methylmalonyl-CoA mutase [Chloroflexota bacterium]